MALRIACDLDGTLADMDAALQQEATRLFGSEVDLHAMPAAPVQSAEDVDTALAVGAVDATAGEAETDRVEAAATSEGRRPLTRGELRTLWAHVRQTENFWAALHEIEPGAVRQLADAANRHRWEVLFLTQRPPCAGATAQVQSQRWLHANGFEWPSVFVMSGSRGKVADALALDVVLDDRPENCLDVATDSKAKPILIWRPRRELLPPGVARTAIETVHSMAEALERLEALMVERTRKRTLVERLRGAIGI